MNEKSIYSKNIYYEIEKLIQYSIKNGFVDKEDEILIRNMVLESIDLDSYIEFSPDEMEQIKTEIENVVYPTEILDNIVNWAGDNDKLKLNTTTFKDLLNSKIMGQIVPRTSEIRKKFWEKYSNEKEDATQYFYDVSKKSNYIRTDRINKNIHWNYESKYGNLEITINLSKPEKDPKEIALAKNKVLSSYPKGLLSKENEGYMGRIDHPGRQNHRTVKINLHDEKWYFQYSPYIYYNEHSIVFSEIERPMKIDKSGFLRLFDFVEQFPHYFIGSNADLPIVGGSILTHDHFQAGKHVFPMEKAEVLEKVVFSGYETIEAGILKWPLSVIRLRGEKDELIELGDKILKKWIEYSDEKNEIAAYSEKERHNTITPITRYKNGKYEFDLVLRNNRTTKEHPLGIFHPHKEHQNIKKENIGLIEVMGLAVLPGRLKDEISKIQEILKNVIKYEKVYDNETYQSLYEVMNQDEELQKHIEWVKRYLDKYEIKNFMNENLEIENEKINQFFRNCIGETFSEVLENCGVFKNSEEGLEGFKKFIMEVNN